MKYWERVKGRVLFDEPLSGHTTFGTGGSCEVWIEPRDEADLGLVLRLSKLKRKKLFIIGNGSNTLARDGGFKGVVVRLGGRCFCGVRFADSTVTAGAGVCLGRLIDIACLRGYRGIEGLVGIPGSLGGAIFTNASYEARISDCLESVRVMDRKTGRTRTIKRKDLQFRYRHSGLGGYIILQATLRLSKADRASVLARKKALFAVKRDEQPLECRSAGCVFKNPPGNISAAQYIDALGLRGKKIGGARISEKHANFIVGLENAKSEDVLRLMALVKRRVRLGFGVNLEPEIKIL